jgi:hypothetical protein
MNNRSKVWCSLFIFALLIVGMAYVSMPSSKAEESMLQQKALAITTEVLGFDTTNYDLNIQDYGESLMPYHPTVNIIQYKIQHTLTSDKETVQLYYTFITGTLYTPFEYGDSFTQGAAPPRDMDILAVKAFLNNYQTYTGDHLYGHLGSMLDNAVAGTNFTTISPDALLQVMVSGDSTTLNWHYADNGVIADSKTITISVKNGVLYAFVDWWHLFPMGSTSINLSQDQARAVALEAAGIWSLNRPNIDIKTFNESNIRWEFFTFDSSIAVDNTHSENLLELYPVWQFGIALDKWYGYMYGLEVDIWADTEKSGGYMKPGH